METERRAPNLIPLGGPQPPRLLDRVQPSRLNTSTISTDPFPRISSKKTGTISAAGFRPKRESASRKWAAAFAVFAVIDRTV